MTIEIQGPFTPSEANETHIREKLDGLHKFFDKITEANVYFRKDDGPDGTDKKAEIRLMIPGNDLYAEAHTDNYMTAFGATFDKVKRQLRKHKEQVVERRR